MRINIPGLFFVGVAQQFNPEEVHCEAKQPDLKASTCGFS